MTLKELVAVTVLTATFAFIVEFNTFEVQTSYRQLQTERLKSHHSENKIAYIPAHIQFDGYIFTQTDSELYP